MGSGIFKVSNLRKTYFYLKKNGIKSAYYAAWERMLREKKETYSYQPLTEKAWKEQREKGKHYHTVFSILVPAYETGEKHFREMVDSVLQQSYEKFQLIIADASPSDRIKKIAETYRDQRICYFHLEKNGGISENTNTALRAATGDYVGLLDHDDVLTPDALYEMAKAIQEGKDSGKPLQLLYSDEDKGDGELRRFYEPHFKPDLNIDLLLSNNYICHFLVIKRELMEELQCRKEYDGAQDYDLVLRAVGKIVYEDRGGRGSIVHVPRVLYHWRCHTGSTAENPESKRYAYEAGKRALEAFIAERGWQGRVFHTRHLGFYRIAYETDMMQQRREVGVVGGKVLRGRKLSGGIYDAGGNCPYEGLHKNFDGYMHRAALTQEAYALDIRCMRVREELWDTFEEVFGLPYSEKEEKGTRLFDAAKLKGNVSREQCLEFGKRVRLAGYISVWLPDMETEVR